MKSSIISLLFSLPLFASAQQPIGHLTIFSEDGDKFFVVLNGEKQNTEAQSNLRIEDLPQPYYSAKIIFEDPSIPPITKKDLQVSDVDGNMMDVTYRIRKDKAGKVKLTPYSAIAVQPDFKPSAGTTVYRYGNPSQTTTTTTTSSGANASINVNGLSMSIQIDDPSEERTTVTRTRTTTTTTTTGSNYGNEVKPANCGWPMKSGDFSAAKGSIEKSSFEESKLSTAKSIISANCLSSDQVVEICRLFDFEATKLTFAKLAYKKVTDPKNYFKVNDVFDFDSSKQELNNYISH